MAMGSKRRALRAAAPFGAARRVAWVLAAALVAAPMAWAEVASQAPPETGAVKAMAPKNYVVNETPGPRVALRFDDGEGKQHSLADFEGKVVLLNVWATWCPPCVKEIPALDRLVTALGDADVAVVAVSVDSKGIDAVRKKFVDLGVHSLAAYIDTSGQAMKAVRAVGLPTSLLLDRDGRVLGRIVGPAAWDDEATAAFLKQAETTAHAPTQ